MMRYIVGPDGGFDWRWPEPDVSARNERLVDLDLLETRTFSSKVVHRR